MTYAARSSAITAVLGFALTNLAACQRAPEPPAPSAKAAPPNTAAPAAANPAAQTAPPATAEAVSASAVTTADASSAPLSKPTVDFSVPRIVAVGKGGEVSFTIAEVAIEPRNSESMRLVLLVRMLNKQRQAADFVDENFRLLTQDSVIPANGGLGETVGAGSESALERVQFLVPVNSVPRALKIEFGGESTELPLTWKR
jgi:hypothetical protein